MPKQVLHVRRIEEQVVPGRRLGRHVHHDPRSADYPFKAGPVTALRSVDHKRYVGPYDQGNLGSCTGNAAAGCLSTNPFNHRFRAESTAVRFYSLATKADEFPGQYKPDDTGSSGLGVAKAMQSLRYIPSYRHAFSLPDAIGALNTQPVIFGINWYDSFDQPDANGVIRISPNAQVRGGHEIHGAQLVLDSPGTYSGTDLIGLWQSWGYGFGLNGRIWIPISDLDRLLAEDGDCTIFAH